MPPSKPPKLYLNEHLSPRLATQLRTSESYLAAGKEHWGIILSTEERTGTLVLRLMRLLNSVTADELKNTVRWLNEFK